MRKPWKLLSPLWKIRTRTLVNLVPLPPSTYVLISFEFGAEVFRPMLERRLTRLEKRLKVPLGECHICEGGLKSATDVYIEGQRVRPSGIHLGTDLRVVTKGTGHMQGLAWGNRREPSPKKPKEEVS